MSTDAKISQIQCSLTGLLGIKSGAVEVVLAMPAYGLSIWQSGLIVNPLGVSPARNMPSLFICFIAFCLNFLGFVCREPVGGALTPNMQNRPKRRYGAVMR